MNTNGFPEVCPALSHRHSALGILARWIGGITAAVWIAVLPAPAAEVAAPATPAKVHVAEFETLKSKPGFVVLDVRTPAEYQEGHVKDAKLINFQSPDFAKQIQGLDKSKTYLVHCARGGRSAKATAELKKAGITNVIDFTDGFEGWKKAGKPVEK